MIQDLLKQNDQKLIELLRDRLFLLKASELSATKTETSDVTPLLAKADVPESIWKSLIHSCDDTLNNAPQSPIDNNVVPRKITIVGGRGRMGKFFSTQLTDAGHHVSVLQASDWEYAEELLSHVDLVLVSVPIESTVDVIKRVTKYISPTTALTDLTSIKTEPVQAMMDNHRGAVLGLHPMFGPNVKSFAGQKVIVCPGRDDDSFKWFLDFMASRGGDLILCSPEEHDQMLIFIQATQHFSRFSLGVFLAQQEIDIERSLLFATASYSQEIDIVKRLFAQSALLCIDIMLNSKERRQAIAQLANTYNYLASLVVQEDRSALIEEFEKTQSFFNK